MSLSVDVIAVRDNLPKLNPMLAVVDACETAGISFPTEVIEYFGEAFTKHGPDPDSLREAMQRINVPVKGDITSDGVQIQLDQLPPDTTAVCIRAREISKASTPTLAERNRTTRPVTPLELESESSYSLSDADLQRQALEALQQQTDSDTRPQSQSPALQVTSSEVNPPQADPVSDDSVEAIDEDLISSTSRATIQFQQLARQIEEDDLYDLDELSAQLDGAEQDIEFSQELDELTAGVEDDLP